MASYMHWPVHWQLAPTSTGQSIGNALLQALASPSPTGHWPALAGPSTTEFCQADSSVNNGDWSLNCVKHRSQDGLSIYSKQKNSLYWPGMMDDAPIPAKRQTSPQRHPRLGHKPEKGPCC